MCENKLQCIICSDIHMSHNDNSRNVSHTFLIDHNLSGPGRSHAQAAKQHLLLISRPPARWATGFSGDLQHNYLLLYIMFCFCNVCTIVLEINILLLLLLLEWTQILLHPKLTPWWSFLFADGAHHKKPHSPIHPVGYRTHLPTNNTIPHHRTPTNLCESRDV